MANMQATPPSQQSYLHTYTCECQFWRKNRTVSMRGSIFTQTVPSHYFCDQGWCTTSSVGTHRNHTFLWVYYDRECQRCTHEKNYSAMCTYVVYCILETKYFILLWKKCLSLHTYNEGVAGRYLVVNSEVVGFQATTDNRQSALLSKRRMRRKHDVGDLWRTQISKWLTLGRARVAR
jgi:hypothetical protein